MLRSSRRHRPAEKPPESNVVISTIFICALLGFIWFVIQFVDLGQIVFGKVAPRQAAPVQDSRQSYRQPPVVAATLADPVVRENPPDLDAQGVGGTAESRPGIFQFTDAKGVIHFVDDADKVPAQYRKAMKVHKDDTGGRAMPVRISGNQVLVPVTLVVRGERVAATLLLDTGATMTTISAELAGRLALDVQSGRHGKATLADGSVVASRIVTVDRLEAGIKAKAPLEVSIISGSGGKHSHDGLLGMNFLRDYRYHIDFDNQKLVWQ